MKKLALLIAFFTVFNVISAQLFDPNDWNKTSLNDFGFYHIYISKYNQNSQLSWDNIKYPWNSPDKKWSNIILPWGNVGIGTLTPDEKLHVLGNAKIEGSIYTYKVLVDSLTAEFLTVNKDIRAHRNILVGGSIGIGVLNPTQKLDIAGNLKVSNSILTDSLIANGIRSGKGVFSNLNISNIFYVSGNTGLGVSNPSERLEVAGNVKVTNSLFSDSIISVGMRSGMGKFIDFSVSNNMFVSGKFGLGVSNPAEKLEVAGNVKVTNSLFSDSIISKGVRSGMGSFSNFSVSNNMLISGNLGLGVSNPAEKLEVDGNIKVTHSLFSDSIISTGVRSRIGKFSDFSVSNNMLISGNLGLGVSNPSEKLEVDGNIKVTHSLFSDSVVSTGVRSRIGKFSDFSVSNNMLISGNLGLGVSNPSEKLEVDGNIKISKSLFSDSIISEGVRSRIGKFSDFSVLNNMLISGNLGLGVSNPSEKLEVDGNIKAVNSIIADSAITKATKSLSGDFMNMNIGNGLFVTGNTGLGVLTPKEKLEVDGSIKATKNIIASAIFSDTATLANGLKVNGVISTNTLYTNAIRINGTPNLSIDNDVVFGGNAVMNQLSIGTGNIPTGYSLSVKGKIIAEEIKVRHFDTWPDYVFSKDYKLKNLYEVEKYINQHQHLEGVPSAQQVDGEGVEVGEMQTKLLEKIEELTLYLIELKKQNDQLTEKVTQLEKQISK